jgi:toxin ParE1/3/4
MGSKIIWTPDALADLKSLRDYIARDSDGLAAGFVERLLNTIDRLVDFPMIGPQIRELSVVPLRLLVQPPYRIIYRVREDREAVFIVAVVHGGRDLRPILAERN